MDQLSSEAVEGTPSYPVNCSNFTSIQFWYLDLTRGISGAVSLLACSFILFVILLHKAYASPLQRFLLYSTLATWLTEASVTMQTEHLRKYSGQRQFCITVAFVEQWTTLMVITIDLEITLLLTYRVYKSLQGQFLHCNSCLKCSKRQFLYCNPWIKCSKVLAEVTAVCLSVFVSLALCVVPLAHGTYGLSGAWCWIVTVNTECKERDVWDQYIVGMIPYVGAGLVIGGCIVFATIIFCMSACQSYDSRRLNCKMIFDNLVLLIFYLVYFTLCSVELTTQLLSGSNTHTYDKYPLWLVYAIGSPLNKLALLVGFLFYMYSFKKLTLGSIRILKGICCKCCQHGNQQAWNYVHMDDDASSPRERFRNVTEGHTYRSSHPQMYPSDTDISPPYTGAFTSITRRDSSDEGERERLIPSQDVGYSSFHVNQRELQ